MSVSRLAGLDLEDLDLLDDDREDDDDLDEGYAWTVRVGGHCPGCRCVAPRRLEGAARAAAGAAAAAGYGEGGSIRQLAERLGLSYGTIHTLLTEHGVQLRGRGGSRRRRATLTARPAGRDRDRR